MNILFVHQNFPAQFKHIAPALFKLGHSVKALTMNTASSFAGVEVIRYRVKRSSTPKIHPWLVDSEAKVIRAEAVFHSALKLKAGGFNPDIIIAHPGWGESLFLKDVWPSAKLGLYAEYYYNSSNSDVDFDKEFASFKVDDVCRLRLKNSNQDLQFMLADSILSPTEYQRSVFPPKLQPNISVIHEGIDTQFLHPNADAKLRLNNDVVLDKNSEVITFINRNLEPMRGYHIFMRSLPGILEQRPNARVIIVGGDDVSYGAKPPEGKGWKNIFLNEVRSELDMTRVHFVGKIPYSNLIKLFQLSKVHVYLTYPFVLSWSLLEAMSIGCAIVASNTAPVQEVIEHNRTGLLVDFFDKENLIRQVVALLDNRDERLRLGLEARKFAVHKFDLRSVCLPKQIRWVDETLM